MASGGFWNHELCPECGKQVEILNGDIPFSMELHLQSHKPLETINHEIEMQYKNPWPQPINSQLSPQECKENAIICDSDASLAIDLQTVIHKTASLGIQTEAKSSVSSKKSKKRKKIKAMPNSSPPSINLLNDIFSSMPLELKQHQGFISVNKKGTLFCNICKVVIEPITSINEHLKTRLHEDRTIKLFTDTLPNDLHHIMEFVSFNNSRLCCNLCRVNFNFFSDNLNDTIFCIMKHNLGKEHLKKNSKYSSNCISDEASSILKSFSRINQIINNNQQYLEVKIQQEFRCKLCNVVVGCNLNETSLYKLLNEHFISETHLTSKASSELEANMPNALNISSEQKHNFKISEGSILCITCNQYVEPNEHELTCHVKQLPSNKIPHTLSSVESEQYMPCPASTENIQSTLKSSKDPGSLSGRSGENKSDYLQGVKSPLTQEMKITQFVVENKVPELLSHTEQLPLNEIICSPLPEESEEDVPTVSKGKLQPTADDLIISNCQSGFSRESNTKNQEFLLESILQHTNVETSVDEFKYHMNQPHNEIPHTLLSAESKQSSPLPAVTENKSPTSSHIKAPLNSSTLSGKESGEQNKKPDIKRILNSLPKKLKDTPYIVENIKGKIMCLVCLVEIPFGVKPVEMHLLGRNHKRNSHKFCVMFK